MPRRGPPGQNPSLPEQEEMTMKRRLFSLLLTGAMLLSMCPPAAAAGPDGMTGGLCPHHQEHSFEDCGHVEAVEGQPCGHVHDGDCGYVEAVPEVPCNMGCAETGEDGQIIHAEGCAYTPTVEVVPCQHEHDGECGYVEAIEGQPCGYVCPVCPVQAMIDALPAPEDVTADTRAEVEAQLEAIDTARAELTDDEAGQLEPARYQVVVSALAALDGQAGADVPIPVADGDITYLYCDSNGQNWQTGTKSSGEYTTVTASDTAWSAGWYVASGNVTISSRVTITGDVHLVLEDGCALTVGGGIQVQDNDTNIDNGSPNSLTIYGQSAGSGTVIASANNMNAGIGSNSYSTGGKITINGGAVTAEASTQGAGIGSGLGGTGGKITINGGTVTARGGDNAAGIGGGNNGAGGKITISGGTVTATGAVGGAGIGGGSYGGGGEITISGGTVTATCGTYGAGIGNGESGRGGTFSTGTDGNAFISAKSINVESGGKLVGNVTGSGTVNLPSPAEQFPALTPGGTYWFDLSGAGIPGTKNNSLPDGSLHWVPFTYAGTINAYKLTSAQATTEEYANQNKYDHSLFIADYDVTHSVSWNDLNGESMIFGKTYTNGGVSYTMRTPSAGSNFTGSGDSERGTPQNNEWDVILNNADEYIKNWSNFRSWGQDTNSNFTSNRAVRGYLSARFWINYYATSRSVYGGFRPVLELPAPADTLTSDSLKVVTLNLNGGKAGTTATAQDGPVNIVVKSGVDFTAPSGGGLTAPSGKVFGGWTNNGTIYTAGDTVPASVSELTVVWATATTPTITTQPENKTVSVGETATFTMTANGEPAPSYQWQMSKDSGSGWEDISGATGGSYTTEAATMSMNGWQYRCVVTNIAGNATSNVATLTVNKLTPTPTTPAGLTATYGQTLADVSLPTGWAWDAPTTSVGNVGNNFFPATYTQDSSGNYNEVKQNLAVTVSAAPRTITVTGQADGPTQVTLNDAVIAPSGTGGTVSYGINSTNTAPTDWRTDKVFSGLTADTTYYFFAKVEANGNYAAAISTGAQIATPAKAVSSIAIANQPTTLSYTSGQTLNLSGLSVTVRYNDGTSGTFAWSDGKLTASPAAGTVLTVTGHNGQTVTISYGGKTADTNTLTVTQGTQAALSITGAPPTIYNGDSFTLTVSGGSGTGAITWEIVSGPATVDTNGKVTATGTGEIQIKAVKAADTDYTQAEATITLNAVARPTPPPTKYLVSVSGGIGGGEYAEGDTVTITATVPSGQRFTGWTVNAGGVTLANASNTTTTFAMPAQAVTVTANFQSNSSGGSSSGGGGGSYTPPSYPPTVERPSEGGGTVAVSPSNPKPGDTVTVKPRPDDGYEVDNITVTDKDGKPVGVTVKPDGTYTFKQPNGKVKIEVSYKAVQPVETPWNNPFSDVSEGDWYYEAVRFVHEQDLMSGYSDGRFGPNDPLSRAQLAQILFNKEGKPVVNYLLDFSDVAGETWYTEAIRWATSQGIVGGYGNGKFGPNDPITREQLAVMLWRYSGSPAATNKELHFTDTDEISGFALEAMRWAVENGILNGYGDGRLGPQGQATRAQVAQMLKNFIENQEENT